MRYRFLISLAVVGLISSAASAQWTANTTGSAPGYLVVQRVGDGSAALSSAAAVVNLDEYAVTGGASIATIALPSTQTSSGNRALTVAGNATSEGFLTLSADGSHLVLTGYNASAATSNVVSTASATNARVIGTIDASGNVDTTTALTDAYTANNIRSATSADGTTFYAAGSNQGIRSATDGGTTSTVTASTTSTGTSLINLRVTNIFNDTLYVSTGAGTRGIYQVGTAGSLPTGTGNTMTLIAATGGSSSPYDFFFADANTLYVADDTNNATGGIQKYVNSGSGFTLQYTINFSGATTGTFVGAHGLAGFVTGDTVNLYATTTGNTANKLVSLTDSISATSNTAAIASETTLATAPTNEAFRGIDFAPFMLGSSAATPEPGSIAMLLAGAPLLGLRMIRRRKRQTK